MSVAEAGGVRIRIIDRLGDIAPEAWNALPGVGGDPFMSWEFLDALETSGCVAPETGWAPRHVLAESGRRLVGAMPLYLKSHSYGEYVFDHAWADALHRAGGRYYPKLQAAAPFTPATGRRILADDPEIVSKLADAARGLARQVGASSVHVTFCLEEETRALAAQGFLARTGVQFHWSNAGYTSFDDFLSTLSSSRRKMLRKERVRAQEGLIIRTRIGAEITRADWDFFFACYQDTGSRKWGRPYLNRAFFRMIGERMGDRVILFVAEDEAGAAAASALNFLGADALYGRYWGRVGAEIPFLHFELCYYQAIEFAIARGLGRVEAGAQGEHKLARGYAPVATHSAHWLAHPGLHNAVRDYLAAERPAIAEEIEDLKAFTPFKDLPSTN
jgi:predicted N-acyltransferase